MNENVQIVKSNYEGPHCLFDNLSAEVEWHEMEGFPYGGVYHGPEEIKENVFQHVDRDWHDFRAIPSEFLPSGDRVVTLGHYEGVSKSTGKPMKAVFAHVYTLRNGEIIQFRQYADSAQFAAAMN